VPVTTSCSSNTSHFCVYIASLIQEMTSSG